MVLNCEAGRCRRNEALGGENDDVAVICAPPFYVSKWRTGRLDRSSRYPVSRVDPCVHINSLVHLRLFVSIALGVAACG